MGSAIETNILTVCGCAGFSQGEDDQSYLARLCGAINQLPDDRWNTLSAEAQSWANEAVAAVRDKQPLKDFPDFVQEDAPVAVAPPAPALPPPPAPVAVAPARGRTPVAPLAPVAVAPVAVAPARGRTPVAPPAPVAPAAVGRVAMAPAAAAAPAVEGKKGGTIRLREILIGTQVAGALTIAQKDAAKMLADEGFAISSQTSGAIYYELKHTLATLLAYGMLAK